MIGEERAIADLKEVVSLLGTLKLGAGAVATAVFDDNRARLHASSEPSAEAFWEVLAQRRCLVEKVDWTDWYRELWRAKHLGQECGCPGRHALHASLIHGRWALLVVADGPLGAHAPATMFNVVAALAPHLPDERVRRRVRRRGGGGPEHAAVGIPLRWILESKTPPKR